MSIKEKILTAFSPAKLVEVNLLRGKEKVIQKGAPSIEKAREGIIFAYESIMPLSLRSKADVEKVNKILKALEAEGHYKKIKF